MKTIHFIRHAQSEANAGQATGNDAQIRLTPRGDEQARQMAAQIIQVPDLIVTSPYLRAQQTAAPLISRYPEAKVVTLPIQEFTYLSPALCADATANQRKNWVFDYWEYAGPGLIHGKGAESFEQFITRITESLAFLASTPAKNIYVFTHGHVLRAIWQLLSDYKFTCSKEQMRHFHQNMGRLPVPNTCIFQATYHQDNWQLIQPQLPEDLFKINPQEF